MSGVQVESSGGIQPLTATEVAVERFEVEGRSETDEHSNESKAQILKPHSAPANELMVTPCDYRPTAAVTPRSLDDGRPSLLTILSSGGFAHIADLLLKNVAGAEGGAQAILNLRKVCRATKTWVDFTPMLSKQIFARIPIKFSPDLGDLHMFEETLPPLHVSSLHLDPIYSTDFLKLTKADVEIFFPTFFSFWSHQMTSLRIARVDLQSATNLIPELLKKPNLFPNLKTLHYVALTDTSRGVHLPNGASFFRRTLAANLPPSLTSLKLNIGDDDESTCWKGWKPEEWVRILILINRRCPLLSELNISSKISLGGLNTWKSSPYRSHLSPNSFQHLRSLTCDLRMKENKNSGAESFLFDILRIHELRLLELDIPTRYRYSTFWLKLVSRFVDTPLSKSLVSLELGDVPSRVVTSVLAPLLSIVAENQRQRSKEGASFPSSNF